MSLRNEDGGTRILRIITRLNVGGPAQHVIFLTERLQKAGWTSLLVSGREDENEDSMLFLAQQRGIVPALVPEMGREISPRQDLIALWKILCLLRKFRPQVLHTHTSKAGFLGRVAGWIYRRCHWKGAWAPRPLAVFHTFHGYVLRGYFSPRQESLFLFLERLLGGTANHLITLSQTLKDDLVRMGIAPAGKIHVVPLGLELDRFLAVPQGVPPASPLRKELGLPDEVPLVGIVGRLVPIKDHATFIEAAALLLRTGAGSRSGKAHFVVVGDGELRKELVEKSRALGIGAECHFLGWRHDLAFIYGSLDLVALTSLNEGTPVSLIEAMAAGRPIVSTAVGGIPDMVGDGLSSSMLKKGEPWAGPLAFLTLPGDAQGIACAMGQVLDDPQLGWGMGTRGRMLASRYTIDRLVADLSQLYREVLAAEMPFLDRKNAAMG